MPSAAEAALGVQLFGGGFLADASA